NQNACMKQNFAAIVLGGTGQVGGADVAELLAAVGSTARSRFRYVRLMGMKEDAVRLPLIAQMGLA
ncbi:MAG: hypothetical protein ABI885_29840, partial [Gammaproteobacteria bacterium]